MGFCLRPATMDDAEILLEWQSHPSTRKYARNPKVPTLEEHRKWLHDVLAWRKRYLWIIESDGVPVGSIRCDLQPVYEVSVVIAPEHRGKGFGTRALQEARSFHSDAVLIAEILPGNDASVEMCRKAGFAQGEDGLWRAEKWREVRA